MIRTRFTIERDVARYALAVPSQAVEAWNTNEIFQGHVTDDVTCACLAACVVFIGKPAAQRDERTLVRLTAKALQMADAWTNAWSEELDWYGPVWGRREVSHAVAEGFIGWGGFDVNLWLSACREFFPIVRAEVA